MGSGSVLAIEHLEGPAPARFKVTRLPDGKSASPVAVASPYEFPVEGRPDSNLMGELRWYLEQFLDYPFPPETTHAEHVLDALKAWGTAAFNTLFDRRDVGNWLEGSSSVQVRSDDPSVLSWPWEALCDPQSGYVAHERAVERRLNKLRDPQPTGALPEDRVNILLVVARPYKDDVRYRSLARPLVELIGSRGLPAHVDVLRPPTFDRLREHLRERPGYYHVLHFDGHGAYAHADGSYSPHVFQGPQGCLVFETENGEPDPKPAHDLSALLREHAVPAVVLNACQSGMLDAEAEDPFASVATALLQSGMHSVVAMAYSLYVSGAQVFLPAFYRRLFEAGSVAQAVRAGRQQMLADKGRVCVRGRYDLEDWLLPVLYQQDPIEFQFARPVGPGLSPALAEAGSEAGGTRLPAEVKNHRDAYGFVGRDSAVLAMERALHRQTPAILVQGLGGVGKTTLARGFLRWLDETGGLDRALWFDFRDIRTADYVINRTGEAFYGENFGIAPNKLELLARAFRETRVLVIWDNFESADTNLGADDRGQLGRFLDAIRGCRGKVIITSRSTEWLGATRRFELRLGGLDGEERWEYCEAVLRELGLKVDRNDPDLGKLMDQLAGHPLAMRVVLPELEKMTAGKITEALRSNLAELGLSEQEEQGRLFATLRFVEDGLSGELRPLLGLVALHEGHVHAQLLESIAKKVDSEWTRKLIDQLLCALAASGLLREVGLGIYELHPLLTSYLRSRSAERVEASQRAFVDVMASLADELTPRAFHEQRVPFDVYGANLYYARSLAEMYSIEPAFCALTQSLASYAQNGGDLVVASRLFEQLGRHCAATGHTKQEAAAYHQLGMIAQEGRNIAKAREWYEKSIAISEREGISAGLAATYHQFGMIAREERDFATARQLHRKSLEIQQESGEMRGVAANYHELGLIAYLQRDFPAARDWSLKSLAIKETQGDLFGSAATYHQLGLIAHEERDFTAAQEWYLKSLAFSEKEGILHYAAVTYHQLGRIAEDQGNVIKARECYLKSLSLSEKQQNLHGAADTYHQLGMIEGAQHNFVMARQWYSKALSIYEPSGDPKAASTYHQLALVAQEEGNLTEAVNWCLKSIVIKEERRDLYGAASSYGLRGVLAGLQDDLEGAARWITRAIQAFLETGDELNAKGNAANVVYFHERASPENKQKIEAIWHNAGLGPFPKKQ